MNHIYLIIAIIALIVLFKNMDEIVRDKSKPTYKLKRFSDGITIHFWDVEKRKWLSPIKRELYYNMFGDINIDYYTLVNVKYTSERDIDYTIAKYENNIELLRKDIKSVIDYHNKYYDDIHKQKKKKYVDEQQEYDRQQEELKRIQNKHK